MKCIKCGKEEKLFPTLEEEFDGVAAGTYKDQHSDLCQDCWEIKNGYKNKKEIHEIIENKDKVYKKQTPLFIDNTKKAKEFEGELRSLINKYSIEQYSSTPDFILAQLIITTLINYASIVQLRDNHYNCTPLDLFKIRQDLYKLQQDLGVSASTTAPKETKEK